MLDKITDELRRRVEFQDKVKVIFTQPYPRDVLVSIHEKGITDLKAQYTRILQATGDTLDALTLEEANRRYVFKGMVATRHGSRLFTLGLAPTTILPAVMVMNPHLNTWFHFFGKVLLGLGSWTTWCKYKRLPPEAATTCPCCREVLPDSSIHYLFECKAFAAERARHFGDGFAEKCAPILTTSRAYPDPYDARIFVYWHLAKYLGFEPLSKRFWSNQFTRRKLRCSQGPPKLMSTLAFIAATITMRIKCFETAIEAYNANEEVIEFQSQEELDEFLMAPPPPHSFHTVGWRP